MIKMTPKSIHQSPCVTMLFLAFLLQCTELIHLCKGAPTSGCIQSEKNALLDLKRGLKDDTNRLSSWTGDDCCSWDGIACSNKTGHVVRLDLRNPHPFSHPNNLPYNRWSLQGKLSSSLLSLKHLHYLDLSTNYFGGNPIPGFIGSLHSLTYLNLSQAGFGGLIPHQLGNISRLQYLDLYNDLDPSFTPSVRELVVDDALWISGLSSLRHLNMKSVNFKNVRGNWVEALNMLPSIVEISLSMCSLDGSSLSLPHVNFTNLSVLDLSYNSFDSIPLWLFNIRSLTYIDLSGNFFEGLVPTAVGNLTNLNVLDLSSNTQLEGRLPKELGSLCKLQTLKLSQVNISRGLPELAQVFSGCIKYSIENLDLTSTSLISYLPRWLGDLQMLKTLLMHDNTLYGPVPESLGRLSTLEELSLSNNKLNGTLPESLGCLSKLVHLDLSNNLLEGIISEAHFVNVTRLKQLELSSNKLVVKVSPNWIPPFRLNYIDMGSCMLGPQFPMWLQMQTNVTYLDISNAGVLDALPYWFWNLFSHSPHDYPYLDISHNGITGRLPDLSDLGIVEFYLNSNYFEGPFPNLSSAVEQLDLSNNSFSGPIHPNIGKSMPGLIDLSLSRNKFTGDIPPSLCLLDYLAALDLSRNFLTGTLPNCWNRSSHELFLRVLDFSSNNLSGSIPPTFGTTTNLLSLQLSNNSLSGEIPSSLRMLESLVVLDLGQNKFTGRIPTWLGESFSDLMILRLRSNMFVGKIPPNLSRLSALQILDFGSNNLSGEIPQSFGNFTAMKVTQPTGDLDLHDDTIFVGTYEESLQLKIKGPDLEYDQSLLSEVILMDLSGNKLSGKIPGELGSLYGLLSLNLSGNHLMGGIPEKIGLLHSLESLDLSRNGFTGVIPPSMSSLTFLVDLNLSFNNLSGSIPSGNQFSTFTNLSYIGNPGLCGFPLTQTCHTDDTIPGPVGVNVDEEEVGSDMWSLYVSMGPGFVVGFCAVLGTLLLKKNWKDTYFQYVDYIYDRVYVVIAVSLNRHKGNVV